MMRKCKVHTARVYVQRFAQMLGGHNGALDVPAEPAGAEFGVPMRLAGAWRLSTGRKSRMSAFFVFVLIDAHAPGRMPEKSILESLP